ncbi:MAG: NADH-quinone oxidoreductase subunit H [Syntrophaceae bacterium]|nr:NADH-quinone oxidoreductase subunit H [Deltaproteobacteria bacterium]
MTHLSIGIAYIFLAPLVGGLLMGVDRIVSARMQRRVGPPLLQPFYDVAKLLQKDTIIVNRLQNPALVCHLVFMIATGFLFFEGSDILLIIFLLTLSAVFLVLAAYASSSPFSHAGAERELILMTAYEPMVLLMLVGFYKVIDSFSFYTIVESGKPLILYLPGIFIGFLYILTMKFRKSPFDISISEHAHQELVSGLTSDFSGRSIALVNIARWYEDVFLLGLVYLFFSFNVLGGIAAVLLTYLFEILIDNTFARFKWEAALRSAWIVALVLGGGNLVILYAFMGV